MISSHETRDPEIGGLLLDSARVCDAKLAGSKMHLENKMTLWFKEKATWVVLRSVKFDSPSAPSDADQSPLNVDVSQSLLIFPKSI